MSAQAGFIQPRVRTCLPFNQRFLSLAQLSDEHESKALLTSSSSSSSSSLIPQI